MAVKEKDFKLFEARPGVGVVLLTDAPKYTVISASNDFVRQTGMRREDVIGKGHFEVFPQSPNDPDFTGERNLKASFEFILKHKEQHQLPIQRYDIPIGDSTFLEKYWKIHNAPVLNDEGEVVYIIHTAQDVTEQVKAEQREAEHKDLEKAYKEIKESEGEAKWFKFMADNAQEPFILMRADGTFAYLNQKALKAWGISEEEGRSIRVPDVDPIYNDEVFSAAFARAQEEEIPPFETLHKRKDGYIYPVEVKMGALTFNGEQHMFAIARDITEQVKARKKMQESAHEIRALVESAPFPIAVYVGKEMRVTYANPSIIEAWGKGPDVIGKLFAEVLPELENQEIFSQLENVFATGTPFHGRNQRVDLVVDEKVVTYYFNYSFTPLYNEVGNVYGVMNTAADVTDLNLAKQKVEQSEKNFRNIILQAPVAMCILLGPEHVVEIANEAMIGLWGKPAAEVMHKPIFDGLPEAKKQGLEQLLSNVYNSGETIRAYERAVNLFRNGKLETTYQNFVYEPYKDVEGGILGVLATSLDVTSQVVARQKIEESKDELQMAIEVADLGTFRIDLLTNKAVYSQRVMDWFGFTEQGLSMEEIPRYVHPDDREYVVQALRKTYNSEANSRHDITYRVINAKDGQVRHLRSFGNTYFNKDGKPYIMIGAIQDVSPQILYQQHLLQSEVELQKRVLERTTELESQRNLLDNILRNSSNGISVTEMIRDEEGKVIDAKTILANDAAVNFTGLPRELYLSITATQLDPNILNSPYGRACLKTLETGEAALIQYQLGVTGRWLELTISKMDDNHLIHIFTDVTAVKKTQLQLEENVAALKRSNTNLEEFAYAASHDLKEPIRKIRTFSDRIKMHLMGRLLEEDISYFQRMEKATERMQNLIDDLLEYSQVATHNNLIESIDLNKKVKQVLEDVELQVAEKNAKVFVESLPVIKGHRRQIQQLFQNLITNALKFHKPGNPPEIHISSSVIKGAGINGSPLDDEFKSKEYNVIQVSDNGIGFQQEYADQIFKMFQRLHGKAEYEGTGIGLAIVRKVAENHRGFIRAESQEGKGATFKVFLPIE